MLQLEDFKSREHRDEYEMVMEMYREMEQGITDRKIPYLHGMTKDEEIAKLHRQREARLGKIGR